MAAILIAAPAAILAWTASGPSRSRLATAHPQVRIKIGILEDQVTISGADMGRRIGRMGQPGQKQLLISWDGRRARVNGKPTDLPIEVSGMGLSVNQEKFRGGIRITDTSPPLIVNVVDVESYVAGVINHEIDSRWPAAAVDAQAVLARTYALKRAGERKDMPFDLDRTVADQVYGGVAAEDDLAWAAVERTRGTVLVFKGELISGHYHSCCGGRTELPSEVWGGSDRPYQKSVVCRYCQGAPRYFWRFPERGTVSGRELASTIGAPHEIVEVEVTQRTGSGRARHVELKSVNRSFRFTGQEFRKLMGYNVIFSTAIRVDREEGGFVFRGSGSGHGAGLCQWGAKGMAEAGFSSEAILGYYFPGSKPEPRGRMHNK